MLSYHAFESSVIPSGSKTQLSLYDLRGGFESSVIPSGSKTGRGGDPVAQRFESSVIPSGSKTKLDTLRYGSGLRVV